MGCEITWRRKAGDTGPALAAQLKDEGGNIVDLSGATGVRAVAVRRSDQVTAYDGPATIVDAVAGTVGIDLTQEMTDAGGIVSIVFVVTWPDERQTFPTDGFGLLYVTSNLAEIADEVIGTIGTVTVEASASSWLRDALVDHVTGVAAMAFPAGVWAQVHIGDPGPDGTANLAAVTARQPITFGSAVDGVSANTTATTWSALPATETLRGLSLWDSSTGGNPLFVGTHSPVQVTAGSTFTLSAGDVLPTLGGALTPWAADMLLDHALAVTTMAVPPGLFVQLHIGQPGPDATLNVAATTDRAATGTMTTAVSGLASNTTLIQWAAAAATEIVSHISVWSAATAGNPIWEGALGDPKGINIGTPVEMAAGQLVVGIQ